MIPTEAGVGLVWLYLSGHEWADHGHTWWAVVCFANAALWLLAAVGR